MSLKFKETTTNQETLCARATLEVTTESGIASLNILDSPQIHATTAAYVFGPNIYSVEASRTAIKAMNSTTAESHHAENPLANAIEESRTKAVIATLIGHSSMNCVTCPELQNCIPFRRISQILTNFPAEA